MRAYSPQTLILTRCTPIILLLCFVSCKKDKKEEPAVAKAFAVYIKNQQSQVGLWYCKDDGTSLTRVTPTDLGEQLGTSPSWSADGRTIYYTLNSERPNENGIFSIKPNGQDPKTIYKDKEGQTRKYYQLIASEDNQLVAFSLLIPRDGRQVIELYKMCPCGTQVVRITSFETSQGAPRSTEAYAGSFSSDSKFLYFSQSFASSSPLKDINIYRLSLENGEYSLLKTVQAENTSAAIPTLSPDGQRLLITLDHQIYMMNSDGTNFSVFSIIKGHHPIWDEDNSNIYFTALGITGLAPGIYRTDRTATSPVVVTRNPGQGSYEGFASNK